MPLSSLSYFFGAYIGAILGYLEPQRKLREEDEGGVSYIPVLPPRSHPKASFQEASQNDGPNL